MPSVDDLLDYLRGRRPACAGCADRVPVFEVEQGPHAGWWCGECIGMLVMFGTSILRPAPEPEIPHDRLHYTAIPGCASCGVRWRPA